MKWVTLKPFTAQSGCVLAFDFGEKRTGVALGELMLGIAHPLETIHAEGTALRFAAISALVQEWQPVLFVVGWPTHLDGNRHALTLLCEKFANRLHGRYQIPAVLMDERLSSVEANHKLKELGLSNKKRKPLLDSVAAQQILDHFFNAYSLPDANLDTREY